MKLLELRVIKETVQNPNFDKRKKRGEGSIAELKDGTKFVQSYYEDGELMSLNGLPKEIKLVDGEVIKDPTLVKLVYSSSAPTNPDCFHDIVEMTSLDPYRVMDIIVEHKIVSIESLINSLSKIDNQ